MRNLLLATLLLSLGGCAADAPPIDPGELPYTKVEPGKEDSSVEAVFLEFDFDAELFTTSQWGPERQIESQLLYTIGQLNGDRGVARLDHLNLEDVQTSPEGSGYKISYHARIIVAWGRRTQVPNEYTLRLPRDMSSAGIARFVEAYSHSCVDWGAHDVDSGSMWYYYRPARSGCSIADGDVVSAIATVSTSDINTTGRFPEYDMVWADDTLRVVAVFGKYEDGATSGDAGIDGYNRFLDGMTRELDDEEGFTTAPAELPSNPGVSVPEVTFRASLGGGRSIEVVAILVDNVRTAGPAFDARYGELSTLADIIVYNGHAGLGANVRALASKGRWVEDQYAIVFMNGCDTYAYVDNALWDAHARVNPDDPNGTRHLDLVMNAMPSYFSSMPAATLALVRGMMAVDAPRTFEQIFADVDSQQVILVSGEQDNTYTPGGGGGDPTPTWGGIRETGHLAQGEEVRFETPTLPAGRYSFAITGSGDADLYVRIGSAPTTELYDCRPYRSDANETCQIDLAGGAAVHLMVRGYTASDFSLMGSSL